MRLRFWRKRPIRAALVREIALVALNSRRWISGLSPEDVAWAARLIAARWEALQPKPEGDQVIAWLEEQVRAAEPVEKSACIL